MGVLRSRQEYYEVPKIKITPYIFLYTHIHSESERENNEKWDKVASPCGVYIEVFLL